ncbi:MAG: hypothetical protein A2Y33_07150 [Spirochaetes bacterium GWF1_51_8]|nr:MAG: hypothetical protein A2Y33_07150 [Spirochaetes bacterium GWF1_51_8]
MKFNEVCLKEPENGWGYSPNDRREMHEFIPLECKRLLEVGCGEGTFGRKLIEQRGIEVWGAELFEEPAKIAEKYFHKVVIGDFEKTIHDLPKKYFDAVVFNDALEHLVDIYQVIRGLKNILADEGRVICSIPNFRYYKNIFQIIFKKDFQYASHGILDYTHLRFFTKKSIFRTFQECGYEIEKIKGLHGPNKWSIFKSILFFFLGDMKYVQYGCSAVIKK